MTCLHLQLNPSVVPLKVSIVRPEQLHKITVIPTLEYGATSGDNKAIDQTRPSFLSEETQTHSAFHVFTVNFDADCCGIVTTKAHRYTFLCGANGSIR